MICSIMVTAEDFKGSVVTQITSHEADLDCLPSLIKTLKANAPDVVKVVVDILLIPSSQVVR